MTKSQKTYLLFGLALLLVFVGSGQFLKKSVVPQFFHQPEIRMMARASHIYILFQALLILLMSQITPPCQPGLLRFLFNFGRVILLAAIFPFLYSFLNEHTGDIHNRTFALIGCVLSLVGVLLICVKAFEKKPTLSP